MQYIDNYNKVSKFGRRLAIIVAVLIILYELAGKNVFLFASIGLFLIIISKQNFKVQIDGGFFLLCVTLLSLCFFANYGLFGSFQFIVPGLIFYLLGRGINKSEISSMSITILLYMAIATGLVHIVLTTIDIFSVGLINPERTLSVFNVSDDSQRAVTQRAVELSLSLCLVAYCFLSNDYYQHKKTKIFFLTITILSLLCIFHYLSRTGLVSFIAAVLVGCVFTKFSRRNVVLILVLIAAIVYVENSSIFDLYMSRELEGSNFSNFGGREILWQWGWELMLKNPWGTPSGDLEHFAHNFWLDYGKEGGLISFGLLVLFSLRNIVKSISLSSSTKIQKNIRFTIVLFLVTFLLSLSTEPIHQGLQIFMYDYFLFVGVCDNLSKNKILLYQ